MRATQVRPEFHFPDNREPYWMAHTVAARPSGSVVAARATGHDTLILIGMRIYRGLESCQSRWAFTIGHSSAVML